MNLNEAFKALEALNEETFSITKDGIEDLASFEHDDELVDEIEVIDPNAEYVDEIEDSYIGKAILDCCICHSLHYEDKDAIQLNDEQTLANVGEECPYCFSADGYKIVGVVAPFEETHDEDKTIEEPKEVEETEEEVVEEVDKGSKEELHEDIQELVVKTDDTKMEMTAEEDGKVVIVTEPIKEECPKCEEEKEEVIVKVTPEDAAEIIDFDIQEFDEESFDKLEERYMRRVYENVKSYKTTAVEVGKNKMKVEGIVEFKSGNKKPTAFVFESKCATKDGKLAFAGANKNISRGNKTFNITGQMNGNKFITESFNYDYCTKGQDGKSTRVCGTIRRKK